MGMNINTTWTQRTTVLSDNYVFKIPHSEQGIEENKSEIELAGTQLVVDTTNLESLGIKKLNSISLFVNKIKSIFANEHDKEIVKEMKSVLEEIKKVVLRE